MPFEADSVEGIVWGHLKGMAADIRAKPAADILKGPVTAMSGLEALGKWYDLLGIDWRPEVNKGRQWVGLSPMKTKTLSPWEYCVQWFKHEQEKTNRPLPPSQSQDALPESTLGKCLFGMALLLSAFIGVVIAYCTIVQAGIVFQFLKEWVRLNVLKSLAIAFMLLCLVMIGLVVESERESRNRCRYDRLPAERPTPPSAPRRLIY
jgi:hypothetical protein